MLSLPSWLWSKSDLFWYEGMMLCSYHVTLSHVLSNSPPCSSSTPGLTPWSWFVFLTTLVFLFHYGLNLKYTLRISKSFFALGLWLVHFRDPTFCFFVLPWCWSMSVHISFPLCTFLQAYLLNQSTKPTDSWKIQVIENGLGTWDKLWTSVCWPCSWEKVWYLFTVWSVRRKKPCCENCGTRKEKETISHPLLLIRFHTRRRFTAEMLDDKSKSLTTFTVKWVHSIWVMLNKVVLWNSDVCI